MFSAIVVCCRLAVKFEAYGISVTLFQIFDSNSRHVEGRRVAPANLDSGRGWKILRERCDVYPCVPWNTVNYVDRVCCCILPDPTYRYWCRIDNENAYPCLAKVEELLLHSLRSSHRVEAKTDCLPRREIACTEKFRTCRFELSLSHEPSILLHQSRHVCM